MVNRPDIHEAAEQVLREFPIFDGHNDLPWALRATGINGTDLDVAQTSLSTDLGRLLRGRVGAQFWSVYVPGTSAEDIALRLVIEQIDLVHRLCNRHPDRLRLVRTADEAREAMQQGRVASLLGAEGGRCIAGSLSVLRMLGALGLRYMTLTHNESLEWADSATDSPIANGLSPFGVEVVSEMNDLGIMVDLSHVSVQTMNAALDHTRAPVIFSHSSCASLTNHPRNVPDSVLERLKSNGGVCMVTFVPDFVSQDVADWWSERGQIGGTSPGPDQDSKDLQRWIEKNPCPPATVNDVADHVERAREVAGVDHVGIGGDYDGCDVMPVGLEDVSHYPVLIEELLSRGWSSEDLAKLTQRNVLRVLAHADQA